GDDVVIQEGLAAAVDEVRLLATIDDAYSAKYGMRVIGHPGDTGFTRCRREPRSPGARRIFRSAPRVGRCHEPPDRLLERKRVRGSLGNFGSIFAAIELAFMAAPSSRTAGSHARLFRAISPKHCALPECDAGLSARIPG